MQMSRQDAEVFMQQEGCPALPDDVAEWQTPHLARALEQGDAGAPPLCPACSIGLYCFPLVTLLVYAMPLCPEDCHSCMHLLSLSCVHFHVIYC